MEARVHQLLCRTMHFVCPVASHGGLPSAAPESSEPLEVARSTLPAGCVYGVAAGAGVLGEAEEVVGGASSVAHTALQMVQSRSCGTRGGEGRGMSVRGL